MRQRSDLADAQQLFDEMLVLGIRAGDQRAGEQLARRWRPRLLRAARRLIGDSERAQDAVQEAWVGIARGLSRLEDPARFAPWAYGILQRRCADILRQTYRYAVKETALVDEATLVHESHAERSDLTAAFIALPYAQRITAVLFYSEGLTLGEIARATDVPIGTTKSRLFHARKQLREYLEE